MQNDAFAPGALFARTAAGSAELSRPASSLSVPQRRLLLLIQQGAAYSALVDSAAVDRDRRRRDLLRLIELQLVTEVDANGLPLPARAPQTQSDSADPLSRFGGQTLVMPPPPSPNVRRPQPAAMAPVATGGTPPRTGDVPGRRGPTVAIVALVGAAIVGGGSWWLTHLGGDVPVAGKVAQAASPQDNSVPAPVPAPVAATPSPARAPASTPAPVLLAAATPLSSSSAPAPALERGLKPAPGTPNAAAASPAPGPAPARQQPVIAPTTPPAAVRAAGKVDEASAKDTAVGATGVASTANPPPPSAQATVPSPRSEPTSAATPSARSEPAATSATVATVSPVDPPRPSASPAASSAAVAAAAQQPTPASTAPSLASAAPTSSAGAASPPPPPAPKILSRVNPDFPREAALAGVSSGTIKARMRVAADGSVTGVEIVQATPARVFDRAVTRALSQWKFEPTGAARTVDHEVEFR